jgi:hypothetical protein
MININKYRHHFSQSIIVAQTIDGVVKLFPINRLHVSDSNFRYLLKQ